MKLERSILPEGEDYGETTTNSKQMSCIPGWNLVTMNRVSSMHLSQMVGAGLQMKRVSHGFLFGTPCLWLQRPVLNW